ncbi:hypothetical protein EZV62_023854 [Acer yangbiense]|uniref:Retrotransposon gag domain-containing protein n=1 Tax=Acer yangbiense TaxID=1000413 RepID=A0A5C7H2W7_9ROSI|nr:hypothetical protein EZV62_023854 [Acer yangbiense]
MAFDSEIAAREEEQTRGHGEQRTYTKRSKSKDPSMDSLEARMTSLEDALSGTQVTLSDVADRLNDLKTDNGEITQATKAMLREFRKGVNEDTCFLTQEFRNLRTFVEHELRAIRAEVEEIRTEWTSYRNSPTVSFGATTSTNTNTNTNTIQILKSSTYSGNHKAMEVENFLFDLEQYFEANGDLGTVIAAAESLLNLTRSKEMSDKHGEERDKPNDNDHKDKGCPKSSNGDNQHDTQGGKPVVIKSKSPCFICDGPHWVRDYPKQKMLNVMVTQLEETKETKATKSQASMGSIQQIYTLNGHHTVPPTLAKKGLMFMSTTIKGKPVCALLDTRGQSIHHPGETHDQAGIQDAICYTAYGETKFSHLFEEQQADRRRSEKDEACNQQEAANEANKRRHNKCQPTVAIMQTRLHQIKGTNTMQHTFGSQPEGDPSREASQAKVHPFERSNP